MPLFEVSSYDEGDSRVLEGISGTVASRSSAEGVEQRSARLAVKTRRRRWLEEHPEYFEDPTLELADPLLYDRMIRQFQTAQEREDDGRRRGYSGKLEADLLRSEAKIEALARPDPLNPLIYRRNTSGAIVAVEEDEDERPKSKADGKKKWRDIMEQRFLRGEDIDFDYGNIDNNEAFDDIQEASRQEEDKYFATESAAYVGEGDPTGETGIQDF